MANQYFLFLSLSPELIASYWESTSSAKGPLSPWPLYATRLMANPCISFTHTYNAYHVFSLLFFQFAPCSEGKTGCVYQLQVNAPLVLIVYMDKTPLQLCICVMNGDIEITILCLSVGDYGLWRKVMEWIPIQPAIADSLEEQKAYLVEWRQQLPHGDYCDACNRRGVR